MAELDPSAKREINSYLLKLLMIAAPVGAVMLGLAGFLMQQTFSSKAEAAASTAASNTIQLMAKTITDSVDKAATARTQAEVLG